MRLTKVRRPNEAYTGQLRMSGYLRHQYNGNKSAREASRQQLHDHDMQKRGAKRGLGKSIAVLLTSANLVRPLLRRGRAMVRLDVAVITLH